jgi:3-oxoacyl-[acyl-carrier protein] reductase
LKETTLESSSALISSLNLKNRVAVVTGGSRGIGRAAVDCFAKLGADVVINYVSDDKAALEAVKAAEEFGVRALAIRADVSRLEEAQRLIQEAVDGLGRVDFLVCNAGIWEGGAVDVLSEDSWDRTIDLNLKGTWTACRAAVPHMKDRGFGRIVIVSSTAGQRGEANVSNYAASKGGQIAFTKSLAAELGPLGINVNSVAPGWVDTDMCTEVFVDANFRKSIENAIPVGRVAAPEDIAWPIVFLCTEWARHINGEILNVNGGSVLCG